MTAWTPGSFAAEQVAIGRKYAPGQPGQPLAEEWGHEEIVRGRFGDLAARRAPPPERFEAMTREFLELVRRRGGDGPVRIDNEHVVIVARRRG
jgi:hypothetical protein